MQQFNPVLRHRHHMPDIFSFAACFMARSKSGEFDSLWVELASLGESKVNAILFAHGSRSFSTLAFTTSILTDSGQGRLKPSLGNFFVASMSIGSIRR